jgi:predicted nucleotidyltransferase component of viral defense system
MKEYIKQIIAESPEKLSVRSLVREYCQARILQFLQERGVFRSWIFHGGTALRFLYMLPRYSEDLDFALQSPATKLDFGEIIASVRGAFEAEAYNTKVEISESKTVKSASIRFPGLLYELGLSPRLIETLSIRIELDSRPPSGGKTETSVFRRFVLLNVLHYDKASFLSGKLHAILARPYVKGRDLYDLFWYLSDRSWPEPNIQFLDSALKQTKWKGPKISRSNWSSLIARRADEVDWKRAVEDVRPFIERVSSLDLLTKENVLKLLKTHSL